MELNYIPSESTVKPSVIQMARSTVFVRRNIVEDVRTDDQGNTTTYWTYEEACLSPSDFNTYVEEVSAQKAISGIHNSENILLLLNGQTVADDNQMIVMEAIADLYDFIASMAGGSV